VVVVDGVDQLRRDTNAIAGFLHAAFQHVADAEILGHRPWGHRLAAIDLGRVARDHEKARVLRQRVEEVVGQSVGQVVLRRIAAQIGERKHGDRGLVGQHRWRSGCASRGRRRMGQVEAPECSGPGRTEDHAGDACCDHPARYLPTPARCGRGREPHHSIGYHPIGPHRPRDVLDLLLAQVLERHSELVAHLVAHHPANADPARLRQGLEPCGDIDAVAKYVALVDDDVADIDANAEFDAALRRHIDVALGHVALDFDGAAYRIDDAGELDQQAVARGLDDAAAVLGDLGIDKLAPMRLQPGERLLLLGSHQPAVAGDIGRQNGRQASLDPLAGQARYSL
jgi:hypothetical protein